MSLFKSKPCKATFQFAYVHPSKGEITSEAVCDTATALALDDLVEAAHVWYAAWAHAQQLADELTVELDGADEDRAELTELRDKNDDLQKQLGLANDAIAVRERVISLMRAVSDRDAARCTSAVPAPVPTPTTAPTLIFPRGGPRDGGCATPGTTPECKEYRVSGKNVVELAKILDRIATTVSNTPASPTPRPGANELRILFHETAKKFGVPNTAYQFCRQGAEYVFTEQCASGGCGTPC